MNAFSSSNDNTKNFFSNLRKNSFNNKVHIDNSKPKNSILNKPITQKPKLPTPNITNSITMYKRSDSTIKWATTRQVIEIL